MECVYSIVAKVDALKALTQYGDGVGFGGSTVRVRLGTADICAVDTIAPQDGVCALIGSVMLLSELLTVQVVIKAVPVSFTVMLSVSVAEYVPSFAVSTRVNTVLSVTEGAVKVVEGAEALANVMRWGGGRTGLRPCVRYGIIVGIRGRA